MDPALVVTKIAEVLSQPKSEYWKLQVKTPVSTDFRESVFLPIVVACGVLISLPYLRHGLVPGLMLGLLSGGFLWGLPYAMCWLTDSVATGMEGVGFGRKTLHLWVLVQIPLAVGLVLGAITEPFVSMQLLAIGGLGYTIYLLSIFLPEVHRISGPKRNGFLVAVSVGLVVAFLVERMFLEEIMRAMVQSSFQNALGM